MNEAKLTPESAAAAVARLALMAFFPGDPDIRAALVRALLDMVETEEQLDWLVDRCLRLYSKWPGVGEIRAAYCSRWKPKDGIEAYSTVYPNGIPSERSRPAPHDPPRGAPVTTDRALNHKIRETAAEKQLPSARQGASDDQETE